MGKYNARGNPYKGRPANPNLSNLTFNITDDLLDGLAYGQSRGWWATRSEGARIVMHRGLNIVIKEFLEVVEMVDAKIETTLDPNKKYVNIPDKGYIEIIGVA